VIPFLTIVPKDADEKYYFAEFLCIQQGVNIGENRTRAGNEATIEIMMWLSKQPSELISVSIEESYFLN
jgi:hypothetical protein